MLRRTAIRRYLLALLYSDAVPQGPDCIVGPLWTNCDGQRIVPLDHETKQIFEDVERSYALKINDAAVVFYFNSVNYQLSSTKVEQVDLVLNIDILANAAGAEARQDIIDAIEERILYRLLSHQSFVDVSTGDVMRSFMSVARGNTVTVSTTDDSTFNGQYTIRTMRIVFTSSECIEKTNCNDEPLCFDWNFIAPIC